MEAFCSNKVIMVDKNMEDQTMLSKTSGVKEDHDIVDIIDGCKNIK
jgi:hypothetical protein